MKKKDITLTMDVPVDVCVLADPEKLRAIFQIMLDNAINYTPAGGSVSIKAYRDEKKHQGIIDITDTGIGMSKETISQIFNQFYRGNSARALDTEGMGVGLFMARNMIRRQNGIMTVQSLGEGKGSTFSVKLPLK